MTARHPEARPRRRISVLNIAVFVFTAVILSSCAGMRGGAKPEHISDGLVEMIREEYRLETIEQNQFILYSGTIRNWNEKEVYAVKADFVGFDTAGKPVIDFHSDLAPKLQPGQAFSFRIKKHMAGSGLDRINAKVTYLREKPSLFGAAPAS